MQINVAHDPTIWVRGPQSGASPKEQKLWLKNASKTYWRAWRLSAHRNRAELRDYVSRVFDVFARWDGSAQLRFLRMRHIDDQPLPIGVECYDLRDLGYGMTPGSLIDTMRSPDPDDQPIPGTVTLENVVNAPRWQRLSYGVRDADGEVVVFASYICHDPDSDALVVARLAADSSVITDDVFDDVDLLVSTISVMPRLGSGALGIDDMLYRSTPAEVLEADVSSAFAVTGAASAVMSEDLTPVDASPGLTSFDVPEVTGMLLAEQPIDMATPGMAEILESEDAKMIQAALSGEGEAAPAVPETAPRPLA